MTNPATLRRRFLAEPYTQRNERGDFSAWHRGRPHYVLWALDADLPAVRARVAAAQRALDGLLLDGYQRQPHVTLALCGFPAQAPSAADEFGRAWLDSRIAALHAARIAPFAIEIGALESFSSAPFLCVRGGGTLGALRACLQPAAAHPQGDYVPHVTVGLYAGEWSTATVAQRFDAFAAGPPLRCEITQLSLMGYVAEEIGGALFTLADWQLTEQRLQWHDTPARPCSSSGTRKLYSSCRSGGTAGAGGGSAGAGLIAGGTIQAASHGGAQ